MTEKQTDTCQENKEVDTNKIGCLVVITGASGTGKDTVIEEVLNNPLISTFGLKLLVSCADRPPRPGEIHGKHHYFITPEEMDAMHINGEFVENPKQYGSSRKASPKKEFKDVLNGSKLLWRIEASLASKVADGSFFDEQFTPEESMIFKQITTVVCITSPKEQVDGRRRTRDGEKYNPKEYELRDDQDEPYLEILRKAAVSINNLDGQLEQTVDEVINHTLKHYAKIKNKSI